MAPSVSMDHANKCWPNSRSGHKSTPRKQAQAWLRWLLARVMPMNSTMLSRQTDNFADLAVSDRKIRRLGFGILLMTFGVFGTWAAVAPIDGAAYAPGVVTVQAYRKTVQHLEGGIVKEVLAHDGDIVKQDDP